MRFQPPTDNNPADTALEEACARVIASLPGDDVIVGHRPTVHAIACLVLKTADATVQIARTLGGYAVNGMVARTDDWLDKDRNRTYAAAVRGTSGLDLWSPTDAESERPILIPWTALPNTTYTRSADQAATAATGLLVLGRAYPSAVDWLARLAGRTGEVAP